MVCTASHKRKFHNQFNQWNYESVFAIKEKRFQVVKMTVHLRRRDTYSYLMSVDLKISCSCSYARHTTHSKRECCVTQGSKQPQSLPETFTCPSQSKVDTSSGAANTKGQHYDPSIMWFYLEPHGHLCIGDCEMFIISMFLMSIELKPSILWPIYPTLEAIILSPVKFRLQTNATSCRSRSASVPFQ